MILTNDIEGLKFKFKNKTNNYDFDKLDFPEEVNYFIILLLSYTKNYGGIKRREYYNTNSDVDKILDHLELNKTDLLHPDQYQFKKYNMRDLIKHYRAENLEKLEGISSTDSRLYTLISYLYTSFVWE